MMAVFSLWWASDTFTGWPAPIAATVTVVCGTAGLVFCVCALRLLRASRTGKSTPNDSDRARRPNGVAFGAVFAAEGVLIGVAVGVLSANSLDRFTVPTIAVIVGVHFFPMARIFDRTIDLWLGAWTTLVGATGITAIAFNAPDWPVVWSWVGLGAAAATLSYGMYMSRYARRLLRTGTRDPGTQQPGGTLPD